MMQDLHSALFKKIGEASLGYRPSVVESRIRSTAANEALIFAQRSKRHFAFLVEWS